jgi:hypothetical protein
VNLGVRQKWQVATILLGVIFVASVVSYAQRPETSNTTLLSGAHIPDDVRSTIERSCRDCHSETTHYPWYAYIAPVAFLINSDVSSGRRRLNFSKWSDYTVIRRERYLSEIANQVKDGGMPLSVYTLIHRNAKLSDSDIEAIFNWTQAERARLINESAAAGSSK